MTDPGKTQRGKTNTAGVFDASAEGEAGEQPCLRLLDPQTCPGAPITPEEAAQLFAGLSQEPKVALAVSGGRDSMALLLLAARWAAADPSAAPEIHVLTVDHGLRAAASKEAEQVTRWARAAGLQAHALALTEAPAGNLQAWARQARLRAMGLWCVRHGVGALVLAHHLEDQAETVLQRISRGSGLDGLAAMSQRDRFPLPLPGLLPEGLERAARLHLVRPLLQVPRARLEATLADAGQAFIEDPSNHDPQFQRVAMRQAAGALVQVGLTPERLALAADWSRLALPVLEAAADRLAEAAVEIHPAGAFRLHREIYQEAEQETRLRLLARLIGRLSGAPLRPRLTKLSSLDEALSAGANAPFRARTLGGVFLFQERGRSGKVVLGREVRAVERREPVGPLAKRLGPIPEQAAFTWDGRWQLEWRGPEQGQPRLSLEGLSIRTLGAAGVQALKAQGVDPVLLPDDALAQTLPSLWRSGELIWTPIEGTLAEAHLCRKTAPAARLVLSAKGS